MSGVALVFVLIDRRRFTFSNLGLIGGKSHVQLVSISFTKVYDKTERRVADCTCGSDWRCLSMPRSLLQSLPVPDDGGLSQAYVRKAAVHRRGISQTYAMPILRSRQ
jgi:hypothetical protein